MYFPWWVLLFGLAASGCAAYLLLERTRAGRSPWALLPLTAALAPLLFLGAAVVALTISISLFALLEGRTVAPTGPPEPPPRTERTGAEAAPPEGTGLTTTPVRTSRTATASPATTSPTASPKASASASPSASAGARTPR